MKILAGSRLAVAAGAVASITLLALAVARPTTAPPAPADSVPSPAAGFLAAVLVQPVVPRWGVAPGGPELLDDWGEHPVQLDAGRRVVVLGEPVLLGLERWVRVWVVPDPSVAPGDFYGWLPESASGRPTLRFQPQATCPEKSTTGAIAALLQPHQLRCFGGESLSLEGRTWLAGTWVRYAVVPDWYGASSAGRSTILSLYEGGPGFPRPPDERLTWLDVHVPPGVPQPPLDFELRVNGRFDDPAATTCQRFVNRAGMVPIPPSGSGLPDETAEDSHRWCRERFVVSDWEALRGPEGRPVLGDDPQLHRIAGGGACGGVGMPPLVVRIDPSEVDPIWLEAAGAGTRILPFFDPGFGVEFRPELVITGPDGAAILRDGDVVSPDAGLPGVSVCPAGEWVSFALAS